MSAYASGQGSHIIPLTPGGGVGTTSAASQSSSPLGEQYETLPSLPQVGRELEAYFKAAQQIEAALMQERSNARRYREELRHLQGRQSQVVSESENRIRESFHKEEHLKSQLAVCHQNEKSQSDQLSELVKQIENLKNEKKRVEIDVELMKAHIDNFKQREESLKSTLLSYQSNEKSHIHSVESLAHDLKTVRAELNRYKASWSQVIEIDRKGKQALSEFSEIKRKMEELNDALIAEKKRNENQEEALKREKREKNAALTCLHSAEARLGQLSRELEELRTEKTRGFNQEGLELNF